MPSNCTVFHGSYTDSISTVCLMSDTFVLSHYLISLLICCLICMPLWFHCPLLLSNTLCSHFAYRTYSDAKAHIRAVFFSQAVAMLYHPVFNHIFKLAKDDTIKLAAGHRLNKGPCDSFICFPNELIGDVHMKDSRLG